LGKNFAKSTSRISNRLMMERMMKAMGDTTPITVVNDSCKNVVTIRPRILIERITPKLTISPKKKIDPRLSLFVTRVAKYTRNPG